jgi:hypothetical protein
VKKLGAEIILTIVVAPWCVWVTAGIFNSQRVEAVQDSKYERIIEKLDELKEGINNHIIIDTKRTK